MDGYGIKVNFDGVCVHAQPTDIIGRGMLGADSLVVPCADIMSVAIKNASLMTNGRLEWRTRDGRRDQLHFTRRQQSGFQALYAELLAVSGRDVPRPVPEAQTQNHQARAGRGRTSQPARAADARPTALRGTGYYGQQVVGESHCGAQLKRLAGLEPEGEREVLAELRREPSNRHDGNAVQVLIDGGVVGYLPREDAPSYQPELKSVESRGGVAQCRARLWWRHEGRGVFASVTLDLAAPGELLPVCRPHPGSRHVVVPAGRWYQVSGETKHMDVLVPLLARAYVPGKAFGYASLHLEDREAPRTTTHVVVVRVDNAVIGELSRQTSTKLAPLLEPLNDAQVTCYAEASFAGNPLAIEARVSLTMPEGLPQEFVRHVQAVSGG